MCIKCNIFWGDLILVATKQHHQQHFFEFWKIIISNYPKFIDPLRLKITEMSMEYTGQQRSSKRLQLRILK